MPLNRITTPFVSNLESAVQLNAKDDPNYYTTDPNSLISTSTIHSFTTGTGTLIYRSLSKLLESTAHELILVTCFWARSESLDSLNDVLRVLSDKAVKKGTKKIRVRICFSSLSVFQQLFHTQRVDGQTYPPSVWAKKLGLIPPSGLGGLDLQIKSVFLLPFSVMHPKFMIIDRRTVILPSCNISWEPWFEGCITFSGSIVHQFLRFYEEFWERDELSSLDASDLDQTESSRWKARILETERFGHWPSVTSFFDNSKDAERIQDIPTIFLPSPHRRNPRFKPFASTEKVVAPPTPLNTFILTLLEKAESSIQIQTPNVTSPPVLRGLLRALQRGVDVSIVTSEKLMMLEQLVTAGTTTKRCIKILIKRYRKLQSNSTPSSRLATDEEAAIETSRPGNLEISYFAPVNSPKPRGQEAGEPQQSHLKMMIVDEEVLVLGSGNLDRASWFTSQELGVAFVDMTLARKVKRVVDGQMSDRRKVVFDSRAENNRD
ncbi:phospholipase D/nuclease [Zopfia rhizophila CBS 207.26]|uniref:Phospholipase D/nuclease n=1 Tax=Zopfia rhizophila CBS 207.26 TaxID=1314779 RepID=A0A6A6EYE1_9PEZI|nr:phospholipase D/nuclease [Zopfia rhizophila CBS 207.26]